MNYEVLGENARERLSGLENIYSEIEKAQRAFRQSASKMANSVSCPPGCGLCCSTFKPDLLMVEADLIALHLLTQADDALAQFRKSANVPDSPACPFQNPSRYGGNCTIYPVRPLICRLFGFSSVREKHGEPDFSLCRHMPGLQGVEPRHFTGAAELQKMFGAIPPFMADYAMATIALDPRSDGTSEPIGKAVDAALERIGLSLKYL
jgi:Fe-S-cluster containining protein